MKDYDKISSNELINEFLQNSDCAESMHKNYDIVIIGAGAAGMMAAAAAGRKGCRVAVVERNEKPGKKIYITGKGRCNITNACDMEEFFQNVMTNYKFMYSSFYRFTNEDVIAFFEQEGLRLKVERGNRVFPVSDKSSDVIRVLSEACRKCGVKILFHSRVKSLLYNRDGLPAVTGVKLTDGREIRASQVIVATGGRSYPSTGSEGDGYLLAAQAGHTITQCMPSLVPMNIREEWPAQMQGLSMKNIEMSFYTKKHGGKKKELYREFGEMMFTYFGITGPVVLSASSRIGSVLETEQVYADLDCKPALSNEKLHRRIVRDFETNPNAGLKNSLGGLLPRSMIPVVLEISGLRGGKAVNQVTREEREKLVHTIKGMVFSVESLRGWKEAVITKGGVDVREIDPGTMESKKLQGLYFAGEVLDVDALTGGFNLQIAWSTGYAAGESAAERVLVSGREKNI